MEALKLEVKLLPLTVRLVAVLEVTEEGEMKEMVGVRVGVGVGCGVGVGVGTGVGVGVG